MTPTDDIYGVITEIQIMDNATADKEIMRLLAEDNKTLRARIAELEAALNYVALREPELDTMPLDKAFRILRDITKKAREALKG